mmetsp:Transcript_122767/g.392457  ORF Transcript_122767/g.392457 Transcript_122767/m.392457 type:complete len:106 (+) Transcript_122767:1167-1484(+)
MSAAPAAAIASTANMAVLEPAASVAELPQAAPEVAEAPNVAVAPKDGAPKPEVNGGVANAVEATSTAPATAAAAKAAVTACCPDRPIVGSAAAHAAASGARSDGA